MEIVFFPFSSIKSPFGNYCKSVAKVLFFFKKEAE